MILQMPWAFEKTSALNNRESLVALQEFLPYECTQLTELPDMRKLTHLRTLWCNSVKALPGLGELISL